MKRVFCFSWAEKSFFLFGIMTATLFFVWAGMLQAPQRHVVPSVDASGSFSLTSSGDVYVYTAHPTSSQNAYGQTSVTAKRTSLVASPGVVFTVTGAPAGVTWQIPPCTPTCITPLKFTVPSEVTPGVYPITVTGNNGNFSATTTLNLTVDKMIVSCTITDAITIPRGGHDTVTCGASSSRGVLGQPFAVDFDVYAGLLHEFNAGRVTYTPASCIAPCSTVLTISIFDDARAGKYLTAVGVYGNGIHLAGKSFDVIVPAEEIPPPSPTEGSATGTLEKKVR